MLLTKQEFRVQPVVGIDWRLSMSGYRKIKEIRSKNNIKDNNDKRHHSVDACQQMSNEIPNENSQNKAGYTAQDAPSMRFSPSKITQDQRTYGRTDGRTDRRTDTTSYRDATAHLKRQSLCVYFVIKEIEDVFITHLFFL